MATTIRITMKPKQTCAECGAVLVWDPPAGQFLREYDEDLGYTCPETGYFCSSGEDEDDDD